VTTHAGAGPEWEADDPRQVSSDLDNLVEASLPEALPVRWHGNQRFHVPGIPPEGVTRQFTQQSRVA